MKIYGGLEAGGTKFICLIGSDPDHILAEERFPTTAPRETIGRVADFFKRQAQKHELAALGIAAFGPVDLDRQSPTYGYITTTPKPGWGHTDLRGQLLNALKVPVAIDTDVNGAAYGEQYWIAENCALDPLLYMTVGTGIGVGVMVNGKPLHGLLHPEAGHMLLPHNWQVDPFRGVCPYHGDCFEGLASGPAIKQRWRQRGETLPPEHPAWPLEAHYIALALVNLTLALSPQRIVLGGGVMKQPQLYGLVRRETQHLINNYLQNDLITHHIDQYIVPPGLGDRSGVLGAVALAASL